MKQTMKRMYSIIALIAVVSGIAGAFAFTLVNNSVGVIGTNVQSSSKQADGDVPFMTLASNTTPHSQQYIDLTEAAEKACNAVVYIKVTINGSTRVQEYYSPFDDFFNEFFGRGNGGRQQREIQTPKRQGAGSGVIISSDGYIVTNNHVVENADEIEVTLNDNREFKATVVGCDESTDLALIKIDATDLPTLVIGDSDNLKVGEWVLAVGNPFNLKSTVTAGIVSAKARKISDGGRSKGNEIESYIQTDAAINAGNSGGALVNANGELVGINAALYSQTGSFTGYGFAIPTSIMKKVVTDLKQYGTVQRALIGVSGMDLSAYIDNQKAQDEKYNKDFGTSEGVYVAEVSENGAAKEAGIKEGDVIVSVNGKKISKMSELQETITAYNPGDKVSVGFIRDKKNKTADVVLKNTYGNTKVVKAENLSALGAEFKEITADQKNTLHIKNGIQIKSLDDDSPLRKMGIGKDFIIIMANNTSISSVADLERVYKSALASEAQTLFIWGKYPSGRSGSYAIELE